VYGPEAYGVFAFFLAIANSISPIATLQLPSGFVAAKDDNEFYDMVKLTCSVLLAGTVICSLAIFFFQQPLLATVHGETLGWLAWFIPIYFFFMGFDNLLVGWNIRLKEFGRSALIKVFSITVSKGITLLAGIVYPPAALGMIVGNLIVYPFESIYKLSAQLRGNAAVMISGVHTWEPWKTLRKFSGYPLYITPGAVINNLSSQLPVYFFSIYFASSYTGFFALAGSLVTMPMSIVINSSTTVFLQKAAELQQTDPEKLGLYVSRLYKRLFAISIVSLSVFALVSDYVFKWVFGGAWELSGVFASFIAMGAIMSVPATPLTVLFRLMFRERLNFIINISFVVIKALVLWLTIVYYHDIMIAIIIYSAVMMLSYIAHLFFIFRISGLPVKMLVRDSFIAILFFAFIILVKL
jgi:O-antigen/teichoic acid export membrane protein